MNETIGELLKELRTARGLSLSALARLSGVTQPTLTRWEAERFSPRLPELEAVLRALTVTPNQRQAALIRLNAPRAIAQIAAENGVKRLPAWQEAAGAKPNGGNLLRAMRLRAGRTRDDIARTVGVSPQTIRRWERSETWPDNLQLQTLCYDCAARKEEFLALTCGRYSLAAPCAESLNVEALEHTFRTELEPLELNAELNAGRDLHFLRLESALWEKAAQHSRARLLLAEVYAHHANYLWNFRLNPSPYLERALEMGSGVKGACHWMGMAIVRSADRAVWGRPTFNPQAGLRTLRLLEHLDVGEATQMWAMRKTAEYHAIAGEHAVACMVAAQLTAHPHLQESPRQQREAGRGAAVVLLKAGRYGEVLDHLNWPDDPYPPNRLRDALCRAEAESGLKNAAYAQNWLTQAYAEIAQHGLEHSRQEADRVAALI